MLGSPEYGFFCVCMPPHNHNPRSNPNPNHILLREGEAWRHTQNIHRCTAHPPPPVVFTLYNTFYQFTIFMSNALKSVSTLWKQESIPVGCIPLTFPSSGACWEATPPLWTEWHTGVKTLSCPKLRLRAVTNKTQSPKHINSCMIFVEYNLYLNDFINYDFYRPQT